MNALYINIFTNRKLHKKVNQDGSFYWQSYLVGIVKHKKPQRLHCGLS